jgi:hypothetical protein
MNEAQYTFVLIIGLLVGATLGWTFGFFLGFLTGIESEEDDQLAAADETGDPRSNGTTIGHEPGVLPQGMTFHAGELGDAYRDGAREVRELYRRHGPTPPVDDALIARACDAYVKRAHLQRMPETPARAVPV